MKVIALMKVYFEAAARQSRSRKQVILLLKYNAMLLIEKYRVFNEGVVLMECFGYRDNALP